MKQINIVKDFRINVISAKWAEKAGHTKLVAYRIARADLLCCMMTPEDMLKIDRELFELYERLSEQVGREIDEQMNENNAEEVIA